MVEIANNFLRESIMTPLFAEVVTWCLLKKQLLDLLELKKYYLLLNIPYSDKFLEQVVFLEETLYMDCFHLDFGRKTAFVGLVDYSVILTTFLLYYPSVT